MERRRVLPPNRPSSWRWRAGAAGRACHEAEFSLITDGAAQLCSVTRAASKKRDAAGKGHRKYNGLGVSSLLSERREKFATRSAGHKPAVDTASLIFSRDTART